MTVDNNNPKRLVAEEGKVLRRKVGYPLTASVIILGEVRIGGRLVPDVAENYEEIDAPNPDEREGGRRGRKNEEGE